MDATGCGSQLTFWKVGQQQVTVDFEGGQVVTDAGLLLLRDFENRLGVIQQLAARFPDPRSPKCVVHSVEAILTQQVYQYLAGYFDANDAQAVRRDPVFLALNAHSPDQELASLASGSTLSRFAYSFTRREAELPLQERAVLLEQRDSQLERIAVVNRYLVDLFVRTRQERPAYVILDLDATDDPTHGQQLLTGFHGHYDQYQYLPLLVFDGQSGFPLAAWLRPGTVHAACGAVQTLQEIVEQLRTTWPELLIIVRGDGGFAIPAMYEFCEREGLLFAIGMPTNAVLKRRTEETLAQVVTEFEMSREPLQKFQVFEDYQADSWSHPRRIVAKVEVNAQGTNRRFMVTNMSGDPQGLYHGFYVQRGKVPEQPIGELKNGLGADRLSSHGFTANSLKFCLHALAYAIFVLHREATVSIPEVSRASVATVRNTLFKVGALVKTSVRRIWFHISATWPNRELFLRVQQALDQFLAALLTPRTAAVSAPLLLLK